MRIAARLGEAYPVLYTADNGTVAHECILDIREITRTTGITNEDIAKRLIDHGFHAPTMSFPVAGTLMVEPTESEPLEEVDRFCDAFEVRFTLNGELVGVAVTDRGEDSLSAVYCFYDPEVTSVGIGTYSILKQIQIAQDRGHRYLYLGLYIEDCPPMAYKARFLPHQRRIHGRWHRFDKTNVSPVRQS